MVIAIYALENNLDRGMSKYIKRVLEGGLSPEKLRFMTKEELWGLIALFAKNLQHDLQEQQGL